MTASLIHGTTAPARLPPSLASAPQELPAPVLSELEQLERQHQERQQQVDKIRAELARIL